METRRQLKIASVIQEAFTGILAREGKGIYGKAFVTLTAVRVTPDLSLVRFYLSILGSDPDEVVQKFNERMFEIKRSLYENLRHQLRIMPEIEFFKDDTAEYAFHIEEVLKKVKEEDENIVAAAKEKPARKKAATKKSAPKKK